MESWNDLLKDESKEEKQNTDYLGKLQKDYENYKTYSNSNAKGAIKPKKRLFRSSSDRKFLGVCGGIASYLNFDPTLLRVIFFVSLFITSFASFLFYMGLAFILPKEGE